MNTPKTVALRAAANAWHAATWLSAVCLRF